jgi:cytochrome c oxidase assembly protein subunit 11
MPWEFRPSQSVMVVNPGAVNNTVFYAKNPLSKNMVAQAVPSISPARAAEYFHKTECFCFTQQALEARETRDMPLRFVVGSGLSKDIEQITLSYTFFSLDQG